MKTYKREVERAIRELDRERVKLERANEGVAADIKKAAKANQVGIRLGKGVWDAVEARPFWTATSISAIPRVLRNAELAYGDRAPYEQRHCFSLHPFASSRIIGHAALPPS